MAEAGEDGSRAIVVSTDVGDPESVKALFDKTRRRFRAAWTCCSTTPGRALRPCFWKT